MLIVCCLVIVSRYCHNRLIRALWNSERDAQKVGCPYTKYASCGVGGVGKEGGMRRLLLLPSGIRLRPEKDVG